MVAAALGDNRSPDQRASEVVSQIQSVEWACKNTQFSQQDAASPTKSWKATFDADRARMAERGKQAWVLAKSDLQRLRRSEKATWRYHSRVTEKSYRQKAREADNAARKMAEQLYDLTNNDTIISRGQDAANGVQDTCELQARQVQDNLQEHHEDAMKELEKWYDNELEELRTVRKQWIQSMSFDCKQGASNWDFGWSDTKKRWCCVTVNTGCESHFDCNAGHDNCHDGWSVEKKDYCDNQNKPCEDSIWDCDAWEPKDWSAAKKDYCCRGQNICQDQPVRPNMAAVDVAASPVAVHASGLPSMTVGAAGAATAMVVLLVCRSIRNHRSDVAVPTDLLG